VSSRHVIFDAAFGDGERFLATWAGWSGGELHYLAVTQELPLAESIPSLQLQALWPVNVPGWHRIVLDDGRVTLDLMVSPLSEAVPQIDARVNEFHLPQMADEVPSFSYARMAKGLARIAVQGASLRASVAAAVATAAATAGAVGAAVEGNSALLEKLSTALRYAGFVCDALDGSGELRAVYASRKPQAPVPPEPVRRAVVIGAGIAGSSVTHRLCARGWEVTLVERHGDVAQEASGNLAGIFMPLLSRDDNIPTRLARAAYLFALREWRRLGGVGSVFDGASCGVLQLARDAEHAQLQRDVVAQWRYPEEYVRWLDGQQASAITGFAAQHGGWLFAQGGWARPASICAAMLAACGARLTRRFSSEALSLSRVGDEWLVRSADGELVAQAPTVILANGNSARKIEQASDLPLFSLRGQVTHLKAGEQDVPDLSLVVCREAYVTPAANGIVSAGATYNTHDSDTQLRAGSQYENMERLTEIMTGVDIGAAAEDGVDDASRRADAAYGDVARGGTDGSGAASDSTASDAAAVDGMGRDDVVRASEAADLLDASALLPGLASAPLAGRVGFRCAAPDRLPLVGALPDYGHAGRVERLRDMPSHPGLHCLLGYASRGLIWAPLMAEVLVSQLENVSSPLESTLAAALDPARFLLKERRRSQ